MGTEVFPLFCSPHSRRISKQERTWERMRCRFNVQHIPVHLISLGLALQVLCAGTLSVVNRRAIVKLWSSLVLRSKFWLVWFSKTESHSLGRHPPFFSTSSPFCTGPLRISRLIWICPILLLVCFQLAFLRPFGSSVLLVITGFLN